MNKTPDTRRAMILRCLTDGMSVRATSRLTGAAVTTILRLLAEMGEFCEGYAFHRLRDLTATRVEADEQWSFVGAKAKNAKYEGQGDIWTFCAIDSDSKLVMSWLVGARNQENATEFVADLASRCANRIQLSTDCHTMYLPAVRKAFKFARVDYARIVKVFGQSVEGGNATARRYSPPVVTGVLKERMIGRPNMDAVSTSYVERLNLNTRQNCRRFTRLTNGFSKKAENHAHAVSLYFMHYNFCRVHATLTKAKGGVHQTPAMAAGVTDRVWKIEDLLALMEPETLIGIAPSARGLKSRKTLQSK